MDDVKVGLAIASILAVLAIFATTLIISGRSLLMA